jgi:hypothetical protein
MLRKVAVLLVIQLTLPSASAWGPRVHEMLTCLVLDGLPADAPEWLHDPVVRARMVFQSNQADRWRDWDSLVLRHENAPEHYLDVDRLDQFGLTLDTIPPLRREYLRLMAVAKQTHPDRVEPYDASKDPARAQEWPGFVLHAVAEHYAKLQAAFHQVRILEKIGDPARGQQLEQSRALVIYHLGDLSHFVADIAQPLHTTRHYDGWVGDNPQGYVWRDRFHAYVDEGLMTRHHIGYADLKLQVDYGLRVNPSDPWQDLVGYLRRSHARVQLLYALERDGRLDQEEGRRLITERLADAAAMISALVRGAYASAEPTDAQVESWANRNPLCPFPAGSQPAPATQPAAGSN